MTTYPYVIISDSVGNSIKRFAAVKYEPTWQDTSNFEITAGGGIDHSVGALVRMIHYVFRIYEDEVDPERGDLQDLKAFFSLRKPTPPPGEPSNILILTDHYGETLYVKFKMDLSPSPVTTQLEGPNALHFVPITFIVVPNVGGSGS